MAFMGHEITEKQGWYVVDGNCGTDYIPADSVSTRVTWLVGRIIDETYPRLFAGLCQAVKDYTENTTIDNIEMVEGYGARLSAPGYLDCTEWSVFDTAEKAQTYLDEYYPEDEDEGEDE